MSQSDSLKNCRSTFPHCAESANRSISRLLNRNVFGRVCGVGVSIALRNGLTAREPVKSDRCSKSIRGHEAAIL